MRTNFPSNDCVVVTGLGVMSPLGSNLHQFWVQVNSPDQIPHDGTAQFAGHIDDFGPLENQTKRLIRKSLKLMNRETQLGVAAAQHAITDSGLLDAGYESDRIGVCFGAGNVEIRSSDFQAGVKACQDLTQQFDPALWGQLGVPHVDPLWILRVLPNMPACHVAIVNDLRGPNNTITQAAVATSMAFAEARNAIIDGDADAMIVGGTGTNLLETLGSESHLAAAPAEAAAGFVIERLEHAMQRNATIYGQIVGTGSATYINPGHQANPPEAIVGAIDNALACTDTDPQQITAVRTNRRVSELAIVGDRFDETQFDCFIQRTGDAAAGSSALGIASTLLALHHSDSEPSVMINIDATDNGLASCLVFANATVPGQARDVA